MFSTIWSSFNDGELSPLLDGRTDIPQYQKGSRILLNMLPTAQGPAVRRGGSRLIDTTRNGTNPVVLLRFSRSQTESYVLAFGNLKINFYFNGRLVLDGANNPYVVTTPYADADLFSADGTVMFSATESIDQIYIAHPKYPPQILSFLGPANWTIAALDNKDGPWEDGNADKASTVFVTGAVTIGSSVTLTSSSGIFKAGHVGSLFRLSQQDLSLVKPWAPGQQTPNIAVNVQRRAGFKTYKCTDVSAGTAPSGATTLLYVQTGPKTPIHTEGSAWDGDQSTALNPIGSANYYSTGVKWEYQDCGYGVLKITSVTNATTAVATVVRQLPTSVVGAGNASYIWEFGAWNSVNGYPSVVTFFRERLSFGYSGRISMSVVGDYANFADMDFGETLPDSAITVSVLSDQVNDVQWLAPQDALIVGTLGGEFVIAQQSISDPFGPLNIRVSPQSIYGGRHIAPIRVQGNTLFVQKNGRSLREFSYAFSQDSYQSVDLSVLSEHVTEGGIIDITWAKNPYSVIWCILGNGNLVSFTYNSEQAVKAWARHDLAGGKAVSITCVPGADGTYDDVYVVVQRVISGGGGTSYSIERIEQAFANYPKGTQQDCFYVDCGLTLKNTINTTLTPGGQASEKGNTGSFTTGAAFFSSNDVGRYIHYDWMTSRVGDDGIIRPYQTRGVAQITDFISNTQVLGLIIAPWPNNNLILANQWRITVKTLSIPSVPWYGKTLSILADGACQPDQLYSGGPTVTLQYPASVVQIGLKSPCVMQTMRPEGGDATGTAQGKLKRVIRATVRLINTLGIELGRDINSLETIEMRDPSVPDDNPPPIFTGDTARENFNGDWDRNGRVMVRQEQPLPLTLCAIAVQINVEEDG